MALLPRFKYQSTEVYCSIVVELGGQMEVRNARGVLEVFVADAVSCAILNFIKEREDAGSHLNEISRSLSKSVASRVTVLDRLLKMQEAGILNSNMELSSTYGEHNVQKWTRKYRINAEYRNLL